MKRHAHVASLLGLGAISGCLGGPDAGAPAQVSQSLNGTVSFPDSSCSTARKNKITTALGILRAQVVTSPSSMLACVRDAILSPRDGNFAETIMAQLAEDMPTTVKCAELGTTSSGATINASAAIDISDESLTIDFGFVDGNTAERVASVILHELAHNKGYVHLGGAEYDYSVPQQVEQCSASLSGVSGFSDPNLGPSRSAFVGEAELQRIGGTGGSPVESRCSGGEFIMGQSIATGSGDITTLGFRCGTSGSTPSNRGTLFTGSGTTSTDLCANDEVVVGVRGYADGDSSGGVHRMGFVCSRWSDVSAGTNTIRRALTERGTSTGEDIERLCPAGMALKGLLGRAGSSLNELRLVCQKTSRYTFGAYTDLATFGTAIASGSNRRSTREFCSDAGVARGLYGRFDGRLDRLGAICHGLASQVTIGGAQLVLRSSGEDHITPAAGGEEESDTAFEGECPSGQALVGYQSTSRSTGEPASVSGLCADVGDWANTGAPAPTVTTITPAFSTAGGASSAATCARGEFLVGFELAVVTNSSGVRHIERVTPVCRSVAISLF